MIKKKHQPQKIKLHFRRFEFKYLMPSSLADQILPDLAGHMVIDEFVGKSDHYIVNSLYFDSPERHCYYEKLDGIKNRSKYRLRSYGEEFNFDGQRTFFEIKRKCDAVVIKDRIVTNRALFAALGFKKLLKDYPEHRDFIEELVYDFRVLRLQPIIFVQYKRKPYFSRYDKNFRITFDYDLQACKVNSIDSKPDFFSNVIPRLAVMEVKFNGVLPDWFSSILRAHNLSRRSFSKYCISLNLLYNLKDQLLIDQEK